MVFAREWKMMGMFFLGSTLTFKVYYSNIYDRYMNMIIKLHPDINKRSFFAHNFSYVKLTLFFNVEMDIFLGITAHDCLFGLSYFN